MALEFTRKQANIYYLLTAPIVLLPLYGAVMQTQGHETMWAFWDSVPASWLQVASGALIVGSGFFFLDPVLKLDLQKRKVLGMMVSMAGMGLGVYAGSV